MPGSPDRTTASINADVREREKCREPKRGPRIENGVEMGEKKTERERWRLVGALSPGKMAETARGALEGKRTRGWGEREIFLSLAGDVPSL